MPPASQTSQSRPRAASDGTDVAFRGITVVADSLLTIRRVLNAFCEAHALDINSAKANDAATQLIRMVAAGEDHPEALLAALEAWFSQTGSR